MTAPARVLIVDDEEPVVTVFSRVLTQAGYEVITTDNAPSALRLVREQRPDVVVLDVVLGGDDGLEVCRQIKADPELGRTFVILVSGIHRDPDHQATGLELGADDYLSKPVSRRELLARIGALLRLRSMENALRESQSWLVAVLGSLHGTVIAVLDREGTYMDVWEDPEYGELYGVDPAELIGTSIGRFLPPEDVADHLSLLQRVADGEEPQKIEIRLQFPNGEFWHEACLSPLKTQEGEASAVVVCSHDVTQRKRVEEDLRLAREELARFKSSCPGGQDR